MTTRQTLESGLRSRAVRRVAIAATLSLAGVAIQAAESREDARTRLLSGADRRWELPEAIADSATAEAVESEGVIEQKLKTIMIPEISLRGIGLRPALEVLASAAEEYDPQTDGTRGINLVIADSDADEPQIDVSLRNLSLGRVLELILEPAGYEYEVTPDAIVVRPGGGPPILQTGYFAVSRAALIRMTGVSADGSGAGSDPRQERDALQDFLQRAGIDFAGVGGSGLAYDGTGIFVTQTSRDLRRVQEILSRYADPQQVAIEARFLEVQEGALDELGINWDLARRGLPLIDPETGDAVVDTTGRQVLVPQETYSTSGVNRTLAEAFEGAQSQNSILIDGERVASTQPSRLPGSASVGTTAGNAARLSGWIGDFDVEAVIRALSQKEGADLLSAPRITVLSGEPASITVAQEMRYPQSFTEIKSQVGSTAGGAAGGSGSAGVTITAGTPQDFATRHVGVELRVTPRVEADGTSISLDLNPTVTDFDGFMEYGGPSLALTAGRSVTVPPGFYQPIFSVRELETKVTVWDGATLVMGGLTREEVKTVDDKVPLLGSIPLLGRLFRSKGESTQKRVLLIFVTARLVSPGGGMLSNE